MPDPCHTGSGPSLFTLPEPAMTTAADLIHALALAPHPEGGHYRETYRCTQNVTRADGAARSACTAIYYLLESGQYSAWHRIASDELWHFYAGVPLDIHIVHQGTMTTQRLGHPAAAPDAVFQHVVPAGAWFAAELAPQTEAPNTDALYSLAGCTVAPGFEFSEFELATAQDLARAGAPDTSAVRRLLASSTP